MRAQARPNQRAIGLSRSPQLRRELKLLFAMHSFLFTPTAPTRATSLFLRCLCLAVPLVSLAPRAQAAKEPSLITGESKSYGYSWKEEMQLGAESDKELTESMGPRKENPFRRGNRRTPIPEIARTGWFKLPGLFRPR